MALQKIYAQLSCSDLAVSTQWFTAVFGRAPDETPMPGLAEWHHGSEAGFQLFQNPDNAGKGTLTLIVSELDQEYQRLGYLKPGNIEHADYVDLIRMRDPDGNLVVLAEPREKNT
jgi:hypothetical protein